MTPDVASILKQHWGYDRFRPLQEEIIGSVLRKKDTLALLPTGGGKSVCYQVPALAQEGLCIVVSPLIALMKDQVEQLRRKGIMALAIYSGMSRRAIIQTLKNAAFGHYKFLYVSPERLETSLFLEYLPALHVNLLAVDEAHCISQWGYDFRPAYLRIAALRAEIPDVPLLALTASATPAVQADICTQLGLREPAVFRQPFTRPNLSYSVLPVEAKLNKVTDVVSKVKGTAIVYCRSRKRTAEIARLLQLQGHSAQPYHAGLSAEERSRRQEDWIGNKVQVMVCTNAFGMGIDKPDVRLVLHADAPDSLESYYQEAGRAGRDGKKAYAVLLCNEQEVEELTLLHTRRYPAFEEIRQVYNAVVNYLQIPVHTGQDTAFTFRFETFVQHFKVDSYTALYALKALESDGWLDFNEKSFAPSTVGFTTTKRQLYDFQHTYPEHEPLLTTLLRTYEGIFDFPVFISESLLAKLMRKTEPEIRASLQQLTAYRVLSYVPQTDEPQIIFRKHRVAAGDLLMNLGLYQQRKEAFMARVDRMVAYIRSATCRSTFINAYFGGEAAAPCGICDNCLRTGKLTVTAEEFEKIHAAIARSLGQQPCTLEALLQQLHPVQKEKVWKVIRYLQAEQKIRTDKSGRLHLT